MKESLKAMNRKELKKLNEIVKEQFGSEFPLENFIYYINRKRKVWMVSRDFEKIDITGLKVHIVGIYIGTFEKDGFRLSIEGAQILKPKKGVISLNEKEAWEFVRGYDIEKCCKGNYIVLKFGEDILGCGKCKEGKILNYVPKARRIFRL